MMLVSPSAPLVVVRRLIRAPRDKVFAAWSNPITLAAFMRPAKFAESQVEVDFRVGGAFRFLMQPNGETSCNSSGDSFWHEGTYTEIKPSDRLAFTWRSHCTGPGGGDSTVTIDLRTVGDATELVLRHERLADEAIRTNHTRGWSEILRNLDLHLSGPAASGEEGFHLELTLAASPAAVYAALATEAGLRGWWSQNCDVGTVVGATSTFRFGSTSKTMIIEALEPEREVRWRCIACDINHPQIIQKDGWLGTVLTFRLEAQGNGTLLRFTHLGLVPEIECYDLCSKGWRHCLGSLGRYLENGVGAPCSGH
jgi:uncharacterized protein YndB with AHSA1/START domain